MFYLNENDKSYQKQIMYFFQFIIIYYVMKQGQQGPRKPSSLLQLKIQNPPPIPGFSFLHTSELASLSNSKWQNNGYVVEKAKRLQVSESVTPI